MNLLTGKVAVITGGAGSLGVACARLFLREGAKVMVVDKNAALVDAAVDALRRVGETVAGVVCDVSDGGQTRDYLDRTVRMWGNIDILFSNAGISGVIRPVTEYPEEIFDAVMAVNVRSSFLACKYGLPVMNDGGSIIITSSVVGVTADPGICAYATSKHALVGLMRTVAKETAGRNIRVNLLCPGPVDNAFQADVENGLSTAIGQDATAFLNSVIPLGRHAQPDEIARMALFLASDQSSFSTGSVFMVDGGMHV